MGKWHGHYTGRCYEHFSASGSGLTFYLMRITLQFGRTRMYQGRKIHELRIWSWATLAFLGGKMMFLKVFKSKMLHLGLFSPFSYIQSWMVGSIEHVWVGCLEMQLITRGNSFRLDHLFLFCYFRSIYH